MPNATTRLYAEDHGPRAATTNPICRYDKVMAELYKTGESSYDILVGEKTIGQVWNWHGSWTAQIRGKTYHNHKSRKEAIARVERIYLLSKQ
jgi:hypothetical protein